MAVGYNPKVVADSLVLSLDASSPKNYNVGVSTNWTDKVGGNNGTLYGGTKHNDGPFAGAGYVEFDGSNDDGFNVSNSTGWFNPNNTSQWTLEGWILNPSSTNIFSIYSGTNNSIANFGCSIGGRVAFQSGNGAWPWVTNSTIVADTGSPTGWNHFAFTKNGSTFEVFLNGSRIYTGTPTFGTGGTGGSIHLQSYFSDGNYYQTSEGLSNVRYVTGSVLYSGTSYTVPTKPFTATGGGTQLLIYQGNTFTDASSNNLTLTKQNSPTANLGFPASAFEFDGSNYDYILSQANPTLNWGTGDFTVELWANVSSSTSFGTLFSTEVNAQEQEENTFVISMNSSRRLNVTTYSTYLISNSAQIPQNTWTHIVVTRQGTTLTLYVDKSSVDTATSSINYVAGGYSTGALPRSLSNTNFTGKVSNIRVYKGKALTLAEIEQNYNALKGRFE